MKLYSVNAGHFKLDGGAMFGTVPKSIWNKLNPADDNNMCSWAMRCLLIEDGNRLFLIDNGMGNKQSEKFFGYYYLHGNDTLEKSLNAAGFSFNDVTDMILSHLHFDHCGGSIQFNKDKTGYEPAFKNAVYYSSERHWKWATEPNPREKPSFLSENILPINESGQLQFLTDGERITENISVMFANGHTDGMMVPHIKYKGKTLVYMADMMPSVGHIPVNYVMGYDTRPLLTMQEREPFMKRAADEEYILFLEHDPINECCTVQHTDKGVRLKEKFSLKEFFAA
ncbi:MAG: putative quorum-quenching lactonase YtnP [Bacteroidia bacterium]|nr:putative quorum-quenching lactonase YtnP [Bacteroidia bacterium]